LDDILQECDGDLKKFAEILPKVKSKDECFCSDAFEIGWAQEKVVFLISKMKDLCRDWLSIDHHKSTKTSLPQLIRDTDSMELDSEVDSYSQPETFASRGFNKQVLTQVTEMLKIVHYLITKALKMSD